ncbi:hypothetical protein RIF29_32780 [Crotalaria pallida]|uniref:DUF7610 domain-containing protein n=1 Tax=Crotalaria pallida TaxID=3830 RepID=A0AAN9EL18_CROPI
MTKSYSILHAKVHELQTTLDDLLLLGPDTESHHHQSKENIKQKLDFIRNLLNAEVASHPSEPDRLQHISERLEALDKAFQQWDNTSPTFPYQDNDFDDKDSTCSCTESCFNDDGEGFVDFDDVVGDKALVEFNGGDKEKTDNMPSFVYEDAEQCFEDFDGDKELVEYERDDELRREERRDGAFGSKCCCALVGGVVIGMVFMGFVMTSLSDCFLYVDQTSFPIPT